MTDSQDLQPTEALTRREMRDAGAPGKALAKTPQPEGAPPATGGLRALIAKHPTAWLASALGVVFLLLGTGAVFAGIAAGSGSAAEPQPSASEIPPRTQPSTVPAATHLRTCSVAAQAADPRLIDLSANVINVSTGETLFDRNGAQPQRTGSVLKVITAAAALNVLGPTTQLTTQVIDGSTPGTIVLKGGGDPTLATGNTVYTGAAQMSDLAEAAMDSYEAKHPDVPITSLVLDSTMWDPADNWDPTWLRKEQTDGYQAEVTALMINGGRANASQLVSPRTDDPIGEAGQAFIDAAGLDGVSVTMGSAVGSTVLAEVKSQPVSTLVEQMLLNSDNILAESLARVVSRVSGFDGSSSSLDQTMQGALSPYNLPTAEITIKDGSGLSNDNGVPPSFMSLLMAKVKAGEQNLGIILSSLPVSGKSGTLAGRFTGANAIAAGAVVAKTGWLDTEYSLSGIVTAADGTVLAFTFYAIHEGITEGAKEALDTLTTAVYSCGNNLSNN